MIIHLLEKACDVFDCVINFLGDNDSCNDAHLNFVGVEGVSHEFCLLQKHMLQRKHIYIGQVWQ
jgi:hypothetical protein